MQGVGWGGSLVRETGMQEELLWSSLEVVKALPTSGVGMVSGDLRTPWRSHVDSWFWNMNPQPQT